MNSRPSRRPKKPHAIVLANSRSDGLLRAESGAQKVVGIQWEDIIAIAMPYAGLLAHKGSFQDVPKPVVVLNLKVLLSPRYFQKAIA